jgi:hypothetical protein
MLDASRIRITNQHGMSLAIAVQQEGNPPGAVARHQRTRFKIRTDLAYRVERIDIDDADDWHVCDVRIGGKSQFRFAGTPERSNDDGVPAALLQQGVFVLDPVQIDMTLAIDVIYRGSKASAAFVCAIGSTVMYDAAGAFS